MEMLKSQCPCFNKEYPDVHCTYLQMAACDLIAQVGCWICFGKVVMFFI